MARPRLPVQGDMFEHFVAWSINREDPQEFTSYQRERYRRILLTNAIVSYKHRGKSLFIKFDSEDRIQFHRSLLPTVIDLVEDTDTDLVVKNTFFLDNLDRVLP